MALTFQQLQTLTNNIAGNIAPNIPKPVPMSPSTLLHGADENSIRYAVRQDALAHPENYQPNAQPVPTTSMLNDPTQLNTVLDVLFNNAALQKAYGKHNISARLKAVRDIAKYQYFKPMLHGQFGVVGWNTLNSLGESVDVFGNITKSVVAPYIDTTAGIDYNHAAQVVEQVNKGQGHEYVRPDGTKTYTVVINGVPEGYTDEEVDQFKEVVNSGNSVNIAKLTTKERLQASIGYGKYGRINFQSHLGQTGVNIGDIVTETLLDPTTWFTLGKSAAEKIAVNGAVDDILKSAAKDVDTVIQATVPVETRSLARDTAAALVDDTARKQISEQALSVFEKGQVKALKNDDVVNNALKSLVGDTVKTNSVYNTYKISTIKDAVQYTLAQQGIPDYVLSDKAIQNNIQRAAGKRVNRMTMTVLTATDKVNAVSDAVQSVLLKAALSPSGVYPIWAIAKKSIGAAKVVNNAIKDVDEIYSNEFGTRKMTSFFDSIENEKRATQVITDELPDDMKLLYKQPEHIYAYEKSALHDITTIDSWLRTVDPSKIGEQTEALRDYIYKAHGCEIEDLLPLVDDICNATDKHSYVFNTYKDVLQNAIDSLHYFEDYAQHDIRIATAHKSADMLTDRTTSGFVYSHFKTLSDNLIGATANSPKGISLHQLEGVLNKTKADTLTNAADVTLRTKYLGYDYKAYAEVYNNKLSQVLDEQTEQILAEFNKLTNGTDILPAERMQELRTMLFNTLGDDLSRGILKAGREYDEDISKLIDQIDSTWNYVGRTKNVIDGVSQIQSENTTKFKAIIKGIENKAHTNTGADVHDLAEVLKLSTTPETLITKKSDDVLATIEKHMRGAKDKQLKLSVMHPNVFDRDTASPAAYSFDTLVNKLDEFVNMSVYSADYPSSYNEVTNILNNAVSSLQNQISLETGAALTNDIKTIQGFLDDLQEKCAPEKLNLKAELITAYEDTFVTKQESFSTLINCYNDKAVNDLVDNLRSGPIGDLLRDVQNNDLYSDEVRLNASIVQDALQSFESTRNFVYRVLLSDIRPETKQGLVSSVMKYYWLDPKSFKEHAGFWSDKIIDDLTNYTQFTKQGFRRHSLDKLMSDPQFRDTVDAAYAATGLVRPETELHQAASDAVGSLGVLNKLAETNEAIQNTINGKVLIGIDCEAMNAETGSSNNILHQCASVMMKDGEHIDTYQQSISPEFLKRPIANSEATAFPEHGYLYKLVDMAEHNTDGAYQPVKDYTQMSTDVLHDFYLKHITSDCTVESARDEDTLLLDYMYNIYQQLEKHAERDPETGKFKAVLVGHNIKGFDLPLWKSKCASRDLYKRAALSPQYGFDLHTLDELEVIDTLEFTKDADNLYRLQGKEENAVRQMLLEYADSMEGNESGTLFTAFSPSDLYHIKSFSDSIHKNPGKALDPQLTKIGLHADDLSDLGAFEQQIGEAKEAISDIFKNNKALAQNYYPAKVITDPKNREYWQHIVHDELGLSDEEAVQRFGQGMSNIQLSSIFAAAGDYQTYAYKWELQPAKQDAWFIETLTRTQAGNLSRPEAQTCNKVIRALESYKKEVKDFDIYASHYTTMKSAVDLLMGTGDFQYLRYLRTDGLSVSEEWAVFKYLSTKYTPDQLESVLTAAAYDITDKAYLSKAEFKNLSSLLDISRDYSLISQDKYFKLFNSDEAQLTIAYQAIEQDVMNLSESFEAKSHWIDNNGLLGSAATLQMKALEPITNVVHQLNAGLKALGEVNKYDKVKFINAEKDLTSALYLKQTQRFINASPDEMLQWLTHSKAHVVFDMYSFDTLDAYHEFLDRVGSEAYQNLNIHYVEDGKTVMVYLTKDAKLRVRKIFDTGEKIFSINGKVVPEFAHDMFNAADFADTYAGVLDPAELQKAINALDYMTAHSCRGSTYEMYSKSVFEKLYERMPKQMKDEFYTIEELSGPLFWDSTPYNFSILGSLANRREYGIGTSGQFINSLYNATSYRMNDHGMKLVYLQAMFNETSALQNTAIGNAIKTDERSVIKYFDANPDYTAAVVVTDKHSPFGCRVVECNMHSVAGVRNALENNARIVSYPEFEKLYEVINTNVVSESSASAWQTIVRYYKIGYLFNPGTWARNGIDAYLKNVATTHSGMADAYAQAFSDIKNYDRIVSDLIGLGHGRWPEEGLVKKYFSGMQNVMDYDYFKTLHAYFSDPAAGSESKLFTHLNTESRKKYLAQLLEVGQIETDEYKKQMTRQAFNSFTNKMLSPMNGVERVSRLAEFIKLSEQGKTSSEALRLVEKTHFSYSTKTPVEQMLETVIPFYTFTSRNFVYWMNAIEQNPAYFSIMRDVLEPALNLDQYDTQEIEDNKSVQRSILSGNIPGFDDYYWNMNFSFLDSIKWLTDPIGTAKNQIFSPVQSIVNVYLQNVADDAYHQGRSVLNTWLENEFGLKMTKQQIADKYGDWADEYMKLYAYKVSSEDPMQEWLTKQNVLQLIPVIGSQIQRLETSGVYMDDGDILGGYLYLAGLAGKVTRWTNIKDKESTDLSKELYNRLQDPATRSKYSYYRMALGYENMSLGQMPDAVKETILALMDNKIPDYGVMPVIQDNSAMQYMWSVLKQEHNVSGVAFSEIPKDTLNQMYTELAKSTVTLADIYDMLSNDPSSRISYSVIKKKLGLSTLKVYQLPPKVLDVLAAGMHKHAYVYGKRSYKHYTKSYAKHSKRTYTQYAKKSYTRKGRTPGTRKGYSGVTPYNTKQGVYANYGQSYAQAYHVNRYANFYHSLYTQAGKSRMEMLMLPVQPNYLKYRIKDYFYYLK